MSRSEWLARFYFFCLVGLVVVAYAWPTKGMLSLLLCFSLTSLGIVLYYKAKGQ